MIDMPHRTGMKHGVCKKQWIYLPEYPILKDIVPYHHDQPSQSETINIYSQIPHQQENMMVKKDGFVVEE